MKKKYSFVIEKTLVKEITLFNFVKISDLTNINTPIFGETTIYYNGYVEKISRRMCLSERKVFTDMLLDKKEKDIYPTAVYKIV